MTEAPGIHFRFAEVEALVQAIHGVDAAASIGSRFRYFQRLRFPGGGNTGRGVPARYGLDELLQVLVAFELVEGGMGPTRVVRTLRTNWPRLRDSIRLGWLAANDRLPWREREVLILEPGALADASRAEDAYVPVDDPLMPIPAFALEGWAEGCDGPARLLVIDPGRLLIGFRSAASMVLAVPFDELDEALRRYGLDFAR